MRTVEVWLHTLTIWVKRQKPFGKCSRLPNNDDDDDDEQSIFPSTLYAELRGVLCGRKSDWQQKIQYLKSTSKLLWPSLGKNPPYFEGSKQTGEKWHLCPFWRLKLFKPNPKSYILVTQQISDVYIINDLSSYYYIVNWWSRKQHLVL